MLIIIKAIDIFTNVIFWAIFIRCLMEWIAVVRDSSIYRILRNFTEPILSPIRDLLAKTPLNDLGLDFSPIFAMLILRALESIIISILVSIIV